MKFILIAATCVAAMSGAAFAQGVQPQGYTGLPYPEDTVTSSQQNSYRTVGSTVGFAAAPTESVKIKKHRSAKNQHKTQ